MNNQSNSQSNLNRILEKINEIVEKSAGGDYIYRGEAECFEKISSSLYREYPHAEGERFNIERDQEAILNEAKEYTNETDLIKILAELQHFSGKTNLIDFTEDYLIALFFASDGSHEKPGRVILQKRESENYKVEKAPKTIKRAEAQKSVFVQSPDGFIEPDIEVDIPIDLKFPMLEYLRKYHRISAETIYNDLHGFIRRSASTEFLKGLTCQAKGDEARIDWVANLFDKCRIVSDDEMQSLWARVLAGEANTPGTYSKRTVNLLSDFDKNDADLFTRLCGFGWVIGNVVPLVFDIQADIYNRNGINFDTLSHLETIGLIQFESLTGFRLLKLPKRFAVSYYGKPLSLEMAEDANNELKTGKVLLTKIGQELAPICGSKPVEGFYEYVKEQWKEYLPTAEKD